jgi:hypothetical protein
VPTTVSSGTATLTVNTGTTVSSIAAPGGGRHSPLEKFARAARALGR